MSASRNSADNSKTAVVFIGNAGAGKSTFLSLLGGNFESGVSFMEGFTKETSEQTVTLDGRQVILMDVPGMYEIDDESTKVNAQKLTKALKRGYKYKLFFILIAHPRGFQGQDLALMSQVNKCVRQANMSKIDFRIIINQIQDDEVYKMYEERVVKDNFQKAFGSPQLKKYNLDIQVNGVMLVRFSKSGLADKTFKNNLAKEVLAHVAIPIVLNDDIKAENKDLDTFL
ncbi:hypothetical protein BGX31_000155, partial [Mortierella sp. GBA43]